MSRRRGRRGRRQDRTPPPPQATPTSPSGGAAAAGAEPDAPPTPSPELPKPKPLARPEDALTPREQAWRKARLSAERRARLYPVVAAQQGGEYCVHCNSTPDDLRLAGRHPVLCIDHVNNNPRDNDRRNLQLLCRSCNTKKNHTATAPAAERPPGPELAINRVSEPAFRRWLTEIFAADPNLQYAEGDLINDAAEWCSVGPDTIGRYLGKAASPRYGMYRRARNEAGTKYVELRPEFR